MIYTVTFNPAVDYVLYCDTVVNGKTNRSEKEEIHWGGKGINVSLMLNQLNIKSTALGFVGGFTGHALFRGLEAEGIKTDFIFLEKGLTRINVKLKADTETEINAKGPEISRENIQELFLKLGSLKDGDTLILSGSIPASLPSNIYEKLLEHLIGRSLRIIVDAEKDLLLNVLKFKPFLIKPNKNELEDIFNRSLLTDEEILECAKELQAKGAVNVLVSLGKDGAVLLDENKKAYKINAIEGEIISAVGSGDSMVAGFLAGLENNSDYKNALLTGSAAGNATAFSKGIAKGSFVRELIDNDKFKITEIR